MHISSDPNLAPGWVVTKIQPPELVATFLVKGTYRVRPGEAAVRAEAGTPATGDEYFKDGSLSYGSDYAPFKPKTDVTLLGTCYTNGVDVCEASFQVGRFSKGLMVVGPRAKKSDAPAQFKRMPIQYEFAYGGEGVSANPAGKPIANLHLPGELDRNEPAGFGPLPTAWTHKGSKLGTYDKTWLKERWPWFPKDFDWSSFNRAPKDQQLEERLRGDEALTFGNLHPEHTSYQSRLPGVRARCVVRQKGRIRDVTLELDTLHVDMDAEKLLLVWRGRIEVATIKMTDIERIFLTTEPLSSAPASADEIAKKFAKPAAFEKPKPAPTAPAPVDFSEQEKKVEEMTSQAEKMASEAKERTRKQLTDAGLDPALIDKPPESPKKLTEVIAETTERYAKLGKEHPEIADKLKDIRFPESKELAELEALSERELPPPERPKWTRERVAGEKDFAGEDLRGLDLSGLDLSGANFSGAVLAKANLSKTKLAGADLRKADMSSANLAEADLTKARLDYADFHKSVLSDARLVETTIDRGNFAQCEAKGSNFEKARGRGVRFTRGNLVGAKFIGAQLPSTDFSECTLQKADFSNAMLPSASIEGACAQEIVMRGANLTGLHAANRPDLSGGDLRQVDGAESMWEGAKLDRADFTGATLTRADFSETSLEETTFDRAELTKAMFADARMHHTCANEANFCKVIFHRADMTGAQMPRTNFYGADFWDAKTDEVNFQESNLKGTKLAR